MPLVLTKESVEAARCRWHACDRNQADVKEARHLPDLSLPSSIRVADQDAVCCVRRVSDPGSRGPEPR